jgi:UDP-GlcNAc:undecaprenyl-phosphate GlcNAc-1-phosphate transferase
MWSITDITGVPLQFLVTATALIASLSLTPAALRLALHFGVVDYPAARKVHLVPIPLWGGLAMYGATVLAIVLFGDVDPGARLQVLGIVAAASLLVLVGSLDDGGVLHHQIKLLLAMPVASVILMTTGIHANVFTTVVGPGVPWALADAALTMLWVVGITAAFSILDHMDGLCAGVSSVAAAYFLLYAVFLGQALVGTLAAAVLGASLGFLFWNFNPARIFMGDGGAMFLGFMMATLGLKLRITDVGALNAAFIPVFILGVPIFDTTLVTISRMRRGLVPFTTPGKDHTSHRLTNLGLGHKRAVLILYAGGAISGAIALLLGRMPTTSAMALVAVAGAASLVGVAALERSWFERQAKK